MDSSVFTSMILISLTSFVTNMFQKYIDHVLTYILKQFQRNENDYSITINQEKIGQDPSQYSQMFLEMVWYINRYHTDNIKDLLYDGSNYRVPCVSNIMTKNININGNDISICLTTEDVEQNVGKDKKTIRKCKRFVFTSKESLNVLKESINHMREDYNRVINEKPWQLYFRYVHDKKELNFNLGSNTPTIDSLLLDKSTIEFLENDIKKFQNGRKYYQDLNLVWKRGYLLHGPPGNGKSTFIKALATEMKAKCTYFIDLNTIYSDNRLLEIYSDIYSILEKDLVVMIVYEDIDCISDIFLSRENKKNDIPEMSRVMIPLESSKDERSSFYSRQLTLSCFLNILDGMYSNDGIITVMTTNHKDKLDPALIRPGRMDVEYEFKNSNKEIVQKIYKKFYKRDVLLENIKDECINDTVSKACNNLSINQEYYLKESGVVKDEKVVEKVDGDYNLLG
jgi:energy-coupling factor transporter ATP-binding protein EcfA2